MTPIRAYNKRGLQLLWAEVRRQCITDAECLSAIYASYGKANWERKCKQFKFTPPESDLNLTNRML